MSTIFVDTDNTAVEPEKKLFVAARAGGAAPRAEAAMTKAVVKTLKDVPGFTLTKTEKSKGYVIRLSLASVEVSGGNTKCSVTGSIVRYPRTATAKRGQGEEMVTTGMSGNATASGRGDMAIVDCVEAIAEDLARKSIPHMRLDFTRR